MGISKMFYKNIEYYRITRTWDYKKIQAQRYVRVGRTQKQKRESLLEAKAIDTTLRDRQIADRLLKKNNGEIYFHPTGKIVGIYRVAHIITKATGYIRDVHQFDIRFNKRNGKSPRYGCVSIHMHGLERAYELAVKKYAAYADIDHNKPLMKLLMDSFKYYQNDPTLKNHNFEYDGRGKHDPLPALEQRLRIDFEVTNEKMGVSTASKIEKNLLKEIEDYQRKNPLTKTFGKNSPIPKNKRANRSSSTSPARW